MMKFKTQLIANNRSTEKNPHENKVWRTGQKSPKANVTTFDYDCLEIWQETFL